MRLPSRNAGKSQIKVNQGYGPILLYCEKGDERQFAATEMGEFGGFPCFPTISQDPCRYFPAISSVFQGSVLRGDGTFRQIPVLSGGEFVFEEDGGWFWLSIWHNQGALGGGAAAIGTRIFTAAMTHFKPSKPLTGGAGFIYDARLVNNRSLL
jgi:hypothetical protein